MLGRISKCRLPGDAFSSIGGRHNAFGMGISESFAFDVGVGGDVGTSGLRTGTVVIDNLDITTGAGMGRGANDGDDVVNVALVVLDHAQPSFSNHEPGRNTRTRFWHDSPR